MHADERRFQFPLKKKGAKTDVLEKKVWQNTLNDRPRHSFEMDTRQRLLLLKKLQLLKLLLLEDQTMNKKYKKRFWVRQLYQARKERGEFHLLVTDMRMFDHELFFRYFRMSPTNFETLLSWVGPRISKQQTKMREPICERERLCVTLRYLVTGDAQVTIAASYRMSPSVVGRIISETCGAIWDALNDEGYIKPPNSEDEWKQVAKDFEMKWNFPNALGAIDGKHVLVQARVARLASRMPNFVILALFWLRWHRKISFGI